MLWASKGGEHKRWSQKTQPTLERRVTEKSSQLFKQGNQEKSRQNFKRLRQIYITMNRLRQIYMQYTFCRLCVVYEQELLFAGKALLFLCMLCHAVYLIIPAQ